MIDNTIHCVFSTDDSYSQHLGVALTSLLENNLSNHILIHIVHHEVSKSSLSFLSKIVAKYDGAQLALYQFDATCYSHFRLDDHITVASYFRLFLAQILPDSVSRAIYFDCDIIVLVDIRPLWEISLDVNLIGAVPDLFMIDNARLGLPDDHCYFNAGVLLIDLAGWRTHNLLPDFLNYVEGASAILRFHDQDALNVILQNRVKYLAFGWNFQARTLPRDVVHIGIGHKEYLDLRNAPAIIHFTTGNKPWMYRADVPFEKYYNYYLQKTPWSSFIPSDKTFPNMIRRVLRRIINALRTMIKSYFPQSAVIYRAIFRRKNTS